MSIVYRILGSTWLPIEYCNYPGAMVDHPFISDLEATPAEGTTTRFAREDIKRYPDIIQAGFADAPYYTNSSQLPVDFSDDVFAVWV